MKKILKILFMLVLITCLENTTVSMARENIPPKRSFRDYTIELYELEEGDKFSLDEKVKGAVRDYYERYCLYTEMDYVLGRSGKNQSDGVYDASKNWETGDFKIGNLNLSQEAIDIITKRVGAPGSKADGQEVANAMKYEALFIKYAEMYGVDPYLLIAMAAQESGGVHRPEDYTGKGACGIMQVEQPGHIIKSITVKNQQTGQDDTVVVNSEKDVWDVEDNIKVGAMEFASRVAEFNGNQLAAIQSYNYGVKGFNTVIDLYAKDVGKTRDQVLADDKDLGWFLEADNKYREEVHNNPNEYFNYSGDTYGDPLYLDRITTYYKGAFNSGAKGTNNGTTGISEYELETGSGGVPHYSMGDSHWGSKTVDFNTGESISQAGCGFSSLSMVLSYFTQTEILPDDLLKYSNKYMTTGHGIDWAGIEQIPRDYGLNCEAVSTNGSVIQNSLVSGKKVIVSCHEGRFTSGGHIIVLSAISDDGKIYVNDPNTGNHKKFIDAEQPFSIEEILKEIKGTMWVVSK